MSEGLIQKKNRLANQWMEKQIRRLLDLHNWNVSASARAAGLDRSNFQRLMRRYGIKRVNGSPAGIEPTTDNRTST